MFEAGEVVYFPEDGRVAFGIAEGFEDSSGRIYVDFVRNRDNRYINGVHIDDFQSETEWRPLPKGWTYNTQLFKLEWRSNPDAERLKEIHVDVPEEIKHALEEGLLVLAKDVYPGRVEAEVDRHRGYRLVKKIPHWTQTYGQRNWTYRRVYKSEAFASYEEAKRCVEEKKAEAERIAQMTDLEWSILEIKKVLRRLPENDRSKVMQFVLSLPDLEDVEVRVRSGMAEWRYFEAKSKWTRIEVI